MLSSLVKEHSQRQAVRREHQETLRQNANKASADLTQALVDHLNVGVAQAYLNQKRLDAEAKQLHTNATDFAKQTQNWLNLVKTFNTTLKDLGDVKNWAKAIEDDMRTVSSTLEYTYKVNREANCMPLAAPGADSSDSATSQN